VKLIDVYPESGAESMNGYQLPIAMEIRRGRYLHSYEHPEPLLANQPQAWQIPLRDHDYAFLKGHRLMVQIQSTWFPVIDRNPQTFVPSIYLAKPADFVSATQRIYTTPEMPSSLLLPVIQ
jgi:predicted acyl esterase